MAKRRGNETREERILHPNYQLVTQTGGWLGRPSYHVAVRVTCRKTKRVIVETNAGDVWASPHRIRKQAMKRHYEAEG